MSETIAVSATWQRLKYTPVRSIAGPEGFGPDDYAADIDSSGDGWVRLIKPGEAVEVHYRAGIASSLDDVPVPLTEGIKRLAAHIAAMPDAEPPAVVTALWRPFRRVRLS